MEKTKDRDNFIRLAETYRDLVFSVCLKMTGDYFTSEDLTQETFLAAYRRFGEFDGRNEKAWLCRIATNKCVDHLRSAERRAIPVEGDEALQRRIDRIEAPEDCEPQRYALASEVMREFAECCEKLPETYRKVALEFFIEGKTAAEIAGQSSKGVKTIQTQIYRAREMLRKSFGKEGLE